ncbi:MAG: hypothetical protein Ct9H300mP25_05650 [Acidobacteriota bacterium]|nr:MAG: hypothetical protein Ct9H300mP25_05650 [Acidobacteriota bacterium]
MEQQEAQCALFLLPVLIVDSQQCLPWPTTNWTPPRTADGHVDLQGVWANNAATPLERPDSLGTKSIFTDEEVAALRDTAQRLFGGADDAAFGDGVFTAVLADIEKNVSRDGGRETTAPSGWLIVNLKIDLAN